jgi:RecB family exonuclease
VIADGGKLLSEFDIDTTGGFFDLKGRIDILAIDKNGNLHIYDLKVSKNPYDK